MITVKEALQYDLDSMKKSIEKHEKNISLYETLAAEERKRLSDSLQIISLIEANSGDKV